METGLSGEPEHKDTAKHFLSLCLHYLLERGIADPYWATVGSEKNLIKLHSRNILTKSKITYTLQNP